MVFERDDRLTANNKEMYLTLEKSGNLVLYCTDGRKIWESETEGATIDKGNGLVIGVGFEIKFFFEGKRA